MKDRQDWFFTFGSAHVAGPVQLSHRFVKISGTFNEARQIMVDARGPKWATQYPIAELSAHVSRWSVYEISIEEVRIT